MSTRKRAIRPAHVPNRLELCTDAPDGVAEEVERGGAGGEEGAPPPAVVLVAELFRVCWCCGVRCEVNDNAHGPVPTYPSDLCMYVYTRKATDGPGSRS